MPRVLLRQPLEVGGAQPTAVNAVTRPGTAVYAQWLHRPNFSVCSCAFPLTTCLSALSIRGSSEASYSGWSLIFTSCIGSCQWGNWKAFAEEAGERPGAFTICLATEMWYYFGGGFHKQSCALFSFPSVFPFILSFFLSSCLPSPCQALDLVFRIQK